MEIYENYGYKHFCIVYVGSKHMFSFWNLFENDWNDTSGREFLYKYIVFQLHIFHYFYTHAYPPNKAGKDENVGKNRFKKKILILYFPIRLLQTLNKTSIQRKPLGFI